MSVYFPSVNQLSEDLQEQSLPKSSLWEGRKVAQLMQHICVGLSVASLVAAIFSTYVLSAPFVLLSFSLLHVSALGYYVCKQFTYNLSVESFV